MLVSVLAVAQTRVPPGNRLNELPTTQALTNLSLSPEWASPAPAKPAALGTIKRRREHPQSGLSFANAVDYGSGGTNAEAVVVADVNGDGYPDLVVANYCATYTSCTKGGVGVLLGNGDGTFQTAVAYGSGGYEAWSVAVADVNGDGYPDLMVANVCASNSKCANGTVGVLLNNGNGTFQTAVPYSTGGYEPFSVAVADLNGNGTPAVVVTNYCTASNTCGNGGSVSVLLGNGDGTFQTAVPYGSGALYAESVAIADINGDGVPDLAVANLCQSGSCTSGEVSVLLGNGDGTFQTAVANSSGGQYAYSVAVADLIPGGAPDLVVANDCASNNCNNGSVGVLLGNGNGTLQTVVPYASGGTDALSVAVADVNGDGYPDLIVANNCASDSNCANGTAGVLLGNGDGTFQTAVAFGSGGFFADSVAVADVNGDGKPDVMVANFCASASSCKGTIGVLINQSNLSTTSTALTSSLNPSSYGQSVTFTATVTAQGGGTPTGTVNFYNSSNLLGTGTLNNGVATYSTAALAVGSHSITAVYEGNQNYAGSTSPILNQTVNKAVTTTVVTSSQNPSNYGQNVTFTATVTGQYGGTPGGAISFYSNGKLLEKVKMVNGVANYSTSGLSKGKHTIKAIYPGNTDYVGSQGSIVQTVKG
jgi:hypothetical protein